MQDITCPTVPELARYYGHLATGQNDVVDGPTIVRFKGNIQPIEHRMLALAATGKVSFKPRLRHITDMDEEEHEAHLAFILEMEDLIRRGLYIDAVQCAARHINFLRDHEIDTDGLIEAQKAIQNHPAKP